MGNFGNLPRLTAIWPEGPADGPLIYAPCVAGLPDDLAATLAILPIHDANGALIAALPDAALANPPDFAGLCLSDPFFRLDRTLDRLRRAGITGVANFPTVAAMLGPGLAEGEQIMRLYRRELQGLDAARRAGFQVLRIAARPEEGATALEDLRPL